MPSWFADLDPQLQLMLAIGAFTGLAVGHLIISTLARTSWRLVGAIVIGTAISAGLWIFVHPLVGGLYAIGATASLASALLDWGFESRPSARWVLWLARPLIYGATFAAMFAFMTGGWLGWVLTVLLGLVFGWLSILGQAFLRAVGRPTYGMRVIPARDPQ
jgi:hypothetical protein